MNHRQKPASCRRLDPAYRQAFERLDLALAENTPSYTLEKIDEIRRILFGAENVQEINSSVEEAENLSQESSS